MPEASYDAAPEVPRSLGAWVNVRDPRDPVACAGGLRGWWPGVREETVNNQRDAHAVERYLGKEETGRVVLTAIPELAS